MWHQTLAAENKIILKSNKRSLGENKILISKTFPNPKYFNGSVCMHIMKKLASNKEKLMSLGLLVVAGYCCVLQDEVH